MKGPTYVYTSLISVPNFRLPCPVQRLLDYANDYTHDYTHENTDNRYWCTAFYKQTTGCFS